MLKRFFEYIRITPRTLIVVLILLTLADGVVRFHWFGLYRAPGRVRLVNEELATLQTMRNEIIAAKGFKILFLGDSAAYGSAVKDSSQTIPAYLEQELSSRWPGRQIKVFNFSFKGFGMSENYFLLNAMADTDLDLVIYNVSTGWFNREKTFEHPNVALLSDRYFGNSQISKTGTLPHRSTRETVIGKVNQAVGRVWRLYQNRSAITTLLLGKSIRAKLTEWQLAITDPGELQKQRKEEGELYRPWYEKDWSVKLGKAGYKFGWVNLNSGNPQVIFYNLMLDLLAEKKLNAFFYTSPQNFTLLDRYTMLDRKAWAVSCTRLRSITSRKGVYLADYTTLVDDRYFSDTVHLNALGNQQVARQLARDISKQLGGNK
ncbi:MAG: hypothetical protein M1609_17335 [Firmicutes bacterium]|nr:hypothetical protein [Bacillota bacterium]